MELNYKMADSSPKKLKILALCDHPLSTSGVGIQSRYLFDGLLKTGKYSIRCFGAAVKHTNYDTIVVNEDFVIKPIDGPLSKGINPRIGLGRTWAL